jgi:hypothetical protein
MTLLVALALGTGASIAAAEVRTQGGRSQGHGGHPVENRCKQPSHATKWYCQPATTTPTTNKPTTIQPTTNQPVTALAVNPVPTVVVDDSVDPTGSGDLLVALSTPPESPPPAVVPEAPPFTGVPGFELPGFDDLLDEGPGGVPLAMALVIAVAGIATIGLVLRGTFGRSPSLPVTDDGESLKFR